MIKPNKFDRGKSSMESFKIFTLNQSLPSFQMKQTCLTPHWVIVSFDEKKWAWFVTSQEYVLRRVEQLVSLKCCSNACTFQTLRFIALEVIILVTATRIKPTVNFIISLIVRFIQTLIYLKPRSPALIFTHGAQIWHIFKICTGCNVHLLRVQCQCS